MVQLKPACDALDFYAQCEGDLEGVQYHLMSENKSTGVQFRYVFQPLRFGDLLFLYWIFVTIVLTGPLCLQLETDGVVTGRQWRWRGRAARCS